MTDKERQDLYEAIDSVADARAWYMHLQIELAENKVEPNDPRFETLQGTLLKSQDRLRKAISRL